MLRSIPVVLFAVGTCLSAGPVQSSWAMARLQLAVAPQLAVNETSEELPVPQELALDFTARGERPDETKGEEFRPYTSLVENGPAAVDARELLQRERSRFHGSVEVGIDSRGGWETRVDMWRQLSDDLLLGFGVSVLRHDDWGCGWEARVDLQKQVSESLSLGLWISAARYDGRGPDWD